MFQKYGKALCSYTVIHISSEKYLLLSIYLVCVKRKLGETKSNNKT